MGKCLANNYWATGDLFAGFDFCQQALDAGLFPAKRLVRPRPEPGGSTALATCRGDS